MKFKTQLYVSILATLSTAAGTAYSADFCNYAFPPADTPVLQRPVEHVASDPDISRTTRQYRMVYSSNQPDNDRMVLMRSLSTDGLKWQMGDFTADLLLAGRDGKWDTNLETPALIPFKGLLYLYYAGYGTTPHPVLGETFPADLGLAISTTFKGEFVRKSDGPVLKRTRGWWDHDAAFSPTLVQGKDGYLYMTYTGWCVTSCKGIEGGSVLLGARSKDGINWQKSTKPVLMRNANLPWMSDGVGEADIVEVKGDRVYPYRLFFSAYQKSDSTDNVSFGCARAKTPLGPWEVSSQPVIKSNPSSPWQRSGIIAPAALFDNNTMRLWYVGRDLTENAAWGYFILHTKPGQ